MCPDVFFKLNHRLKNHFLIQSILPLQLQCIFKTLHHLKTLSLHAFSSFFMIIRSIELKNYRIIEKYLKIRTSSSNSKKYILHIFETRKLWMHKMYAVLHKMYKMCAVFQPWLLLIKMEIRLWFWLLSQLVTTRVQLRTVQDRYNQGYFGCPTIPHH